MDILQFLSGILGGGVAYGILDWIRANNANKRKNKINIIMTQIEKLYGPLYFFSSQNKIFFTLNNQFHQAYQLEYVDKDFSPDKTTQENITFETEKTLDLANSYMSLVLENNDNIISILRENFAYLDSEDIDVFNKFTTDYLRMKNETAGDGQLITPLRVYKHIGNISFMRPEFIDHVEKKFNDKKSELSKLIEKGKKKN